MYFNELAKLLPFLQGLFLRFLNIATMGDGFIKKDLGPVVFVGGMNAMPMMYAIELRKLGYDVLYLVDRPITDKLSRPENHFSEIQYPYPDWIVELPVLLQVGIPFVRSYLAHKVVRVVHNKFATVAQAYVLNGFFISLAPFLPGRSKKIALSHGSDLDSWADLDGVKKLAKGFKSKSVFKFMPGFVAEALIRVAVARQYQGFRRSDKVIYFPRGFNRFGDRVLDKLIGSGVDIIERYDISFEPLKKESRSFRAQADSLVVFSGVRFAFKTFAEGNDGYAKGNEHIINGLGRFYKCFKRLEIHFVEKGPDVDIAKQLCSEVGLDPVVVWHKEMKFTELLDLYRRADVCFDQVGSHWIGAIGGYALWLGKPLIANDHFPVSCGIWPVDNPVCSASNAEDVYQQLVALQDVEMRKNVSDRSKKFAEKFFAPTKVVVELVGDL